VGGRGRRCGADRAWGRRYRYSLASLQGTQAAFSDNALWGALRALQEESLILQRMVANAREEDSPIDAWRLQAAAERIDEQATRLRALVEEPRPRAPGEGDAV
jgi:two-component system chemotaxis response regulator CheB